MGATYKLVVTVDHDDDDDSATFECTEDFNFIVGLPYSQSSLTDACDGDGVCDANPIYGSENSIDDAVAWCEAQCAASECTGFFFQKHQNGHEICGFYNTNMQAEGAQWVWHGHAAGSRVCEVVEDDHVDNHHGEDSHGEDSHHDDQDYSDTYFVFGHDQGIFAAIAFGVGSSAAFVCILKHRRARRPVAASPVLVRDDIILIEKEPGQYSGETAKAVPVVFFV